MILRSRGMINEYLKLQYGRNDAVVKEVHFQKRKLGARQLSRGAICGRDIAPSLNAKDEDAEHLNFLK